MAESQATANPLDEQPSSGSNFVNNITALPVAKQVGLVIALAATVALIIGIISWSQAKPYTLLFGSVDPKDMNEIIQTLDQAQVPYKLESNGIMVPQEQVHALRLQLAAAGFPKETATGYQLLDAEQGFGISQFKETTQYHRALEGELAKSVSSINSVKSARVMLGLPKRTVFVRKQQNPTASVVVQLLAGRSLGEEQVNAIVYLVSSSIPNMNPNDVTVVDQNGNLLTADQHSGSAGMLNMSMKQLDYTRQIEMTLSQRIIDLLAPIVGGPNRVRAQVTAEMDFTQQEQTRENYQPDPQAIRSEQEIKEINRAEGPQGIPGALTNQPPEAGIAPEEGLNQRGAAGADGIQSSSEKRTKNYELDRTISHIKNSVGTIQRLSVAVVLDDKVTTDENGEPVRTPITEDELQRYQSLVRDTVGLDVNRGDTVSVVNASFVMAPEDEFETLPIWQEPWFWDIMKQVLAGLAVLIIVFGVIRPMLKDLSKREELAIDYPEDVEEEREEVEDVDEISKALEQMNEEVEQTAMASEEESDDQHELLEKVRTIVAADPKAAAIIIRQWMQAGEEE